MEVMVSIRGNQGGPKKPLSLREGLTGRLGMTHGVEKTSTQVINARDLN